MPDPRAMRFEFQLYPGFMAGIGVGLALAGVTVLTVGAARRTRARNAANDRVPLIDGVHDPAPPELDARPAEEANTLEVPRLESEAPDVPPLSQRW